MSHDRAQFNRFVCFSLATGFAFSAIVLGGCARGASVDQRQQNSPAVVNITGVDVRTVGTTLIIQYRTQTSIRDCRAQEVEMPAVWSRVVKPRLDTRPTQVVLSPEERSGQSVGIAFSKNSAGQWTAVAPCSIVIPAT
jgi:hypothetical protein